MENNSFFGLDLQTIYMMKHIFGRHINCGSITQINLLKEHFNLDNDEIIALTYFANWISNFGLEQVLLPEKDK